MMRRPVAAWKERAQFAGTGVPAPNGLCVSRRRCNPQLQRALTKEGGPVVRRTTGPPSQLAHLVLLLQAGGVPVRPVFDELLRHEYRNEDLGQVDEDKEPLLAGDDRRQCGDQNAERAVGDLTLVGGNVARHEQRDDHACDDRKDLVHGFTSVAYALRFSRWNRGSQDTTTHTDCLVVSLAT